MPGKSTCPVRSSAMMQPTDQRVCVCLFVCLFVCCVFVCVLCVCVCLFVCLCVVCVCV